MAKSANQSEAVPNKGMPSNAFGGRRPPHESVKKERARNTSTTLKRLWRYMYSQRSRLYTIIMLSILSAGLGLIAPYLLGRAIDEYIIPRDADGLLQLCLALAAVYAFSSAASWLQSFMMARFSQQMVRELRRDLFDRLQRLPLGYFDRTPHGDLMSRTTNDIENLSTTLNQSLIQLVTSVVTLIGALTIMLTLNVWLTLISLIVIPLIAFVTKKIAARTRRYFKGQQESLGQLNGYIEESISGQKIIKLCRREEAAAEEFHQKNEKLREVSTKAQIMSGLVGPMMNMSNHFTYIIISVAGGWMAYTGMIGVGIIVSFLNYSKQLSGPINELANQYNMIQSGIAGAERVFEVMDNVSEYKPELESKQLTHVTGKVEFEDVCFSYTSDHPILKHVSFTANPGDVIALVGPTGAGKTTIINLLTRFYDIDSGTIRIDGQDISGVDKDQLREQLGIVLQDAFVFSDSIRDNIRYGRLDATEEEIIAAAKLANAHEFIHKLPDGYDTQLVGGGSNLSHGQRQLITIARAILADPSILILDEATSSVDTRTEMSIQAAMNTLMQGRTSFVIAHRLSTIRNANLILVIHDGAIIERGTHDQLMEMKGFYYELTSSQYKQRAV